MVVEIAKKFNDEVNGLFIDTHFKPQEHVTLQGVVHSVPRRIIDRQDYADCSLEGIEPGDSVMFRYNVIYSYARQGNHETPTYKNLMFIHGKEYWRCDIVNIIARIRGKDILMLNRNLMVAPISNQSKIILPNYLKHLPRVISSKVTHIGLNPSIDVKEGDEVYFDPKKAQQYKVGPYEFVILKERMILGKEVSL